MLLCIRCGAEEMDIPFAIAVPAKGFLPDKTDRKASRIWSQVSQNVCPVCGAQHVNITCSPIPRSERSNSGSISIT